MLYTPWDITELCTRSFMSGILISTTYTNITQNLKITILASRFLSEMKGARNLNSTMHHVNAIGKLLYRRVNTFSSVIIYNLLPFVSDVRVNC